MTTQTNESVKTKLALVLNDTVMTHTNELVAKGDWAAVVEVVAFSSLVGILGEGWTTDPPSPCAFLSPKCRSAHAQQFHSLGQDQSTVA